VRNLSVRRKIEGLRYIYTVSVGGELQVWCLEVVRTRDLEGVWLCRDPRCQDSSSR
jgi:hypothetical protein